MKPSDKLIYGITGTKDMVLQTKILIANILVSMVWLIIIGEWYKWQKIFKQQ